MAPVTASRMYDLKGRYIARVLAELYPDQVNRLIQTPIFVRVSLCLQLCHRRAFGRQFHNFELEQVDVIVEVNGHIHTPMTAAILYGDVKPQCCEIGIKHAGIVAFKIGDVVVGVPLVGILAKKAWKSVLSPSKSLASSKR